jgi:hypothetical protein
MPNHHFPLFAWVKMAPLIFSHKTSSWARSRKAEEVDQPVNETRCVLVCDTYLLSNLIDVITQKKGLQIIINNPMLFSCCILLIKIIYTDPADSHKECAIG